MKRFLYPSQKVIVCILTLVLIISVVAGCQEPETKQITLKQDAIMLNAGETHLLTAETGEESVRVTWSSSNEAVATISEDGTVTGVAEGESEITASADGYESAVCKVIVTAGAKLEEVTLSVDSNVITFKVDGTYEASGTYTGLGFDIPFSVTDTYSVSDGKLTLSVTEGIRIELFGQEAFLTAESSAKMNEDGSVSITIGGSNETDSYILAEFTMSKEDAAKIGMSENQADK